MENTPLIRMGRRWWSLRGALWLLVGIIFIMLIFMRQKPTATTLEWKIGEEEMLVNGKPVTKEWMEVSDDAVLPPGLDIEIDMATHKKRVRLPQANSNSALMPVEDDEFTSDPLNKMGRVYAAHKTLIDEQLEALKDPKKREEALNNLEAQGGNLHIGAGLIRSPALGNLVSLIENGKCALKAADILFSALHNNPTAIAFVYRTPLIKQILKLLGDKLADQVIKRLLGTLAAIFRFDTAHTPRQFMAENGVSALERVANANFKTAELIDRILTTLLALLDSNLESGDLRQLAEMVDRILAKTGIQGHADWMEHSFKPFCKRWPDSIKGLSHFNNLCLFLSSQP